MAQEQAGETLGPVKDLASEQDVSPAAEFSPEELIDVSQEAPPPSDSGLREGDEELAGPSSEDLAFNDDDDDSDPVAFDAAQSDGVGELEMEVAQQVVQNLASTAKAPKATNSTMKCDDASVVVPKMPRSE